MFSLPVNTNNFPLTVPGYNTTDPVIGNISGQSNLPLEALADRTEYLFDRLGRFLDVIVFDSSVGIGSATKYILHYAQITSNIVFSLDDIANFQHGAIYTFKCKAPSNKSVRIDTTPGQKIKDGSIAIESVWLHDGEDLELVVFKDGADDHFVVFYGKGNFDKVGQDDFCRFQPRNSFIANGCNPETSGVLYLRTDYPRYWDRIKDVAIDDSLWLASIDNRGMNSSGNGSTTFRVADLRAMFHRGLDLGRGVRLGNTSATSGSYEADGLKSHDHGLPGVPLEIGDNDRGGLHSNFSIDNTDTTKRTGFTGTDETKPKNIGFIPIIYY